jgi:hypothetical protein
MATRDEKNKFSLKILELAAKERLNHIEAVTVYCEENSFEIELAATLLNDHLKEIIQSEAQDLRFLPRQAKLAI